MVRYARSYRRRKPRTYRRVSVRKTPRRARRYTKRARIYRAPVEFPSTMRVKLRYADDYTLTLANVAGLLTTYSVNSPYDPLVGVGGGKCSGFDQWAAIYQRYRCYTCKVDVSGVATTNDNGSLVVGLRGRNANLSVPASTADYGSWLIESKDPCYRRLAPWVTPQPYPKFRLSHYYDVRRLQGIRGVPDDTDYSGDVGSDPSTQCVFDLVAGSTTGLTTASIQFRITITYYVEFFQPQTEHNAAV